jgi:hypothetical protein
LAGPGTETARPSHLSFLRFSYVFGSPLGSYSIGPGKRGLFTRGPPHQRRCPRKCLMCLPHLLGHFRWQRASLQMKAKALCHYGVASDLSGRTKFAHGSQTHPLTQGSRQREGSNKGAR